MIFKFNIRNEIWRQVVSSKLNLGGGKTTTIFWPFGLSQRMWSKWSKKIWPWPSGKSQRMVMVKNFLTMTMAKMVKIWKNLGRCAPNFSKILWICAKNSIILMILPRFDHAHGHGQKFLTMTMEKISTYAWSWSKIFDHDHGENLNVWWSWSKPYPPP